MERRWHSLMISRVLIEIAWETFSGNRFNKFGSFTLDAKSIWNRFRKRLIAFSLAKAKSFPTLSPSIEWFCCRLLKGQGHFIQDGCAHVVRSHDPNQHNLWAGWPHELLSRVESCDRTSKEVRAHSDDLVWKNRSALWTLRIRIFRKILNNAKRRLADVSESSRDW